MTAFYSDLKKLIFLSLLAAGSLPVFSETFRTSHLHYAAIEQAAEAEVQKSLGTNESLAIKLPENRKFIEGIEIKFDIPEDIAYWQDCVACSVYSNITPAPSENMIDYSGSRQFVSTLPGRLSWVLQIPLKKPNSFRQNHYTTLLDNIPDFSDGVIFIRLQPVMKGVPEETLNSRVRVFVRPVLSDKGELRILLADASGGKKPEAATIYVDDKLVSLTEDNTLLLEKGVHDVSVISNAYRNEVRTVRTEQATTTEIKIELKSIEPSIVVTAPEGTSILIDDERFRAIGKETIITEGEHKIHFTVGDYEIVRTINAIKGKTYRINCSVDLLIEEE